MIFKRILFMVFAFVTTVATPALANQPPGPHQLLAEVLILPIMALLTAIGGGYAILRRTQKKKPSRVLNFLAAVLIIFFSFINAGLAMLVVLMFSLLALVRGIQMLYWGLRVRISRTQPAHLTDAKAGRLILAGTALVLAALFLVGMTAAFLNPYSYIDYLKEDRLKNFVAYQLAYAQLEKEKTGDIKFHHITDESAAPYGIGEFVTDGRYNVKIEFKDADKHFTALVPPLFMPIFPYNYMTSAPSYRADESGQIRMVRVRHRNQLCPPDAPVVMKVSAGEIAAARQTILSFHP